MATPSNRSRITQALPVIQAPLQPADMPSARAPDDGSRPRLTRPKVIELGGHNGAGLVDGQADPDEASDETQERDVYILKRVGRLAGRFPPSGCPIAGCRENESTDSARGGNMGLV
jgi:hypothetical protein